MSTRPQQSSPTDFPFPPSAFLLHKDTPSWTTSSSWWTPSSHQRKSRYISDSMAASLVFPRPFSLPFHPSVRPAGLTKQCRFGVTVSATNRRLKDGVAIVWFKQDLRVDDHPGLIAAAQYSDCLPLYVFDHRLLRCERVHFLVSDSRNLSTIQHTRALLV